MGEWKKGQIVITRMRNGIAIEQSIDGTTRRRRIAYQDGILSADIVGDDSPGTTDLTEIGRQVTAMLKAAAATDL